MNIYGTKRLDKMVTDNRLSTNPHIKRLNFPGKVLDIVISWVSTRIPGFPFNSRRREG